MTLSFSTTWPNTMPKHLAGKPTDFVHLFWNGLRSQEKKIPNLRGEYLRVTHFLHENPKIGKNVFPYDMENSIRKVHTVREDLNNRWQPGKLIHPVINNRTPERFQFAPTIPCVSTQKIEIIYSDEELCDFHCVEPVVKVDGRVLDFYKGEVDLLAANDGFNDTSDFFHWFNKDFTGKIIHWTDLKY